MLFVSRPETWAANQKTAESQPTLCSLHDSGGFPYVMTWAPWILPELPRFMDPSAVQETWMREATLRTIGTVALHVMAANGPCKNFCAAIKVVETLVVGSWYHRKPSKPMKSTKVTGVPSAHHNSPPKNLKNYATTSWSCVVYLQHPTARNWFWTRKAPPGTNRIMFFKIVTRTIGNHSMVKISENQNYKQR